MAKKFDLGKYKESIKISDTPLKKDTYVTLDEALHSVMGVPGIPLGHITQVFGKSDTGKTSLLFHAAAKAQQQGVLPVVIITEGKIDWNRAKAMGFDRDNAIINDNAEFLEDVFAFVDKITADVSSGELPQDVLILWDSLGNTLSREEITQNKDGTYEKRSTMMKAAKVVSEHLRVLSRKINDTRKISYPKSVGWMILNQAYTAPPAFTGASSKLVPYGGDAVWFRSSLVLKTSRVTTLTAKKDGTQIKFGIVSKISVDKNHLTNVAHSGDFVIVSDAIFPNEKGAIDDYKELKKDTWGSVEVEEKEE